MNKHVTSPQTMISPEALALLGGGKIAYVKTVRSEDVHAMFPQAPELKPGMQLFALHAAGDNWRGSSFRSLGRIRENGMRTSSARATAGAAAGVEGLSKNHP